jgi:hypothetical protein
MQLGCDLAGAALAEAAALGVMAPSSASVIANASRLALTRGAVLAERPPRS